MDSLTEVDLDALAARAAAATTREAAWDVLDEVRRPEALGGIDATGAVDAWAATILDLIDRSDLTMGTLFARRASAYGAKTLFEVPGPSGGTSVSWRQAALRVDALARGLLALAGGDARVAIVSGNRLEMALVDLACHAAGLVSILIPTSATEADIAEILGLAHATVAVVSEREPLLAAQRARGTPGSTLSHVVVLGPHDGASRVLTLDDVIARAPEVRTETVEARRLAVKASDLATIMYTSGTTGRPKGVKFSHRNLVFKRFARALALPAIGEDDVLLCYLPLFHTFGRFLEMYGCVFWGATYCFLDNPSVEALVAGMRRYRPTVFISVPKKWMQLHEAIVREADPDVKPDAEVAEAVRRLTGGRLRWGLSAAGHLDADVFRFFQRHGVELMSGFGMTEATGGITMTRPGRYRDDSLGTALPGIELAIGEDGELSIRGPYVMIGHVDPPEGERTLDADGWFPTGDLMELDAGGHLRLVDRKKEIYKNIKGETIAPARVENLFREFGTVGRVFLVGDHREYNTALIWPSPEPGEIDLSAMTSEELKAHFRSIVASVNAFVAPFERIVDFALIDRDFSVERGELTAKGTPRRKAVEASFADTVRLLYRRAHLKVGGQEVIFPNWLFQALGVTAQDLRLEPERIGIPQRGSWLTLRRLQDGVALVGSCVYRHPPGEPLPLGVLLTTPRLWLGNEELVAFIPLDTHLRERPGRAGDAIERSPRVAPGVVDAETHAAVTAAQTRRDLDLMDLHRAARLLESSDEAGALAAVALLGRVAGDEEGPLSEPAREVLRRAASAPFLEVRRRAFTALAPAEREGRVLATIERFLASPGVLLDASTREALCERTLSDERLDAFVAATRQACEGTDAGRTRDRRGASLLRFLAAYGASHPVRYRPVRAFLVRMMLFGGREAVRQESWRALDDLVRGFRGWLGPSARLAVDPETGQEYQWEQVVAFDDAVPARDRERLLGAIKETALLREAVFLFSGGATPRLADIPPGGVWIRALETRHGKAVYRVTVQTRFQGAYDLAVNVNHSRTGEQVREEIRYLILCGESGERAPLVEDFGGYWPIQDLWSEEFIPGETLDRALRRQARAGDPERLRYLWPFLAWSTLAAHVDFWNRTGRAHEIADPGMTSVIVSPHDYHTGARIVSVASVRSHEGLVSMCRFFREGLVEPVEREHPELAGMLGWGALFAPLLEIVGEQEGLRMLREILHRETGEAVDPEFRGALASFVSGIEVRGYVPMRLYFAVRRYARWASLSADATPQARARTLQEFWDTYGLATVAQAYPETRARFFLETAFRGAPAPLVAGLEEIVGKLRRGELDGDGLVEAIADLRARLTLGPDEDAFLARLSFPHLRPEDAAGFVQSASAGRPQSEMVVTLEDEDGDAFHVRHALTPKEVARLHRLFLAAKLDVRFRPEHQYLVAVSERGVLIGGIYYEIEDEGRQAHLEKIVVAERYRRKGVADGLMREFFHRMRAAGASAVTTGFFRPEYFYAYGFKIEKRYAGLVKELGSDPF